MLLIAVGVWMRGDAGRWRQIPAIYEWIPHRVSYVGALEDGRKRVANGVLLHRPAPKRSDLVHTTANVSCRLWLRLGCAAGVSLGFGAASAPAGVMTLPGLNPGFGITSAYAINNSGVVVGDSTPSNPGPPRQAAVWNAGVLSTLPGITGAPAGGVQGVAAFGINNSGVVVGTATYPQAGPGGNFASRAVRWTGGVPSDLGVLPGFTVAAARAINDSGEVAGSSGGVFAGSLSAAVRWNSTDQVTQLDFLPTHTSSDAFDINAAGRIVGWSGVPDGDFMSAQEPTLWDGATATPITLPADHNMGLANGINDAGQIVGTSIAFNFDSFTYDDVRATSWIADVPTILPLLADTVASTAARVNASGLTIGACYLSTDEAFFQYNGVPVLWTDSGAMDLRPLLLPTFPTATFFVLSDINDAGQITGYAVIADAEFSGQSFVLTVPNGATLGLALSIGVATVRRRRA